MALDIPSKNIHQLKEWIVSAINEKKSMMRFEPEPINNSDFNIDLSCFGFKDPHDLEYFLLTPTGKVLETELAAEKAQEEQYIEEQQKAQEIEIKKNILKIHLLLWLISKEALAADKVKELIEEYNKKTIETTNSSPTDKSTKELKEALNIYDVAINDAQTIYEALESKETKLDAQLIDLEQQIVRFDDKEIKYNASLEAFEQESSRYYQLNPEELDDLIKKMEIEVTQKTELIMSALDSDEELKAYSIQAEQVALSLKLESLYDLRSIQKDKKIVIQDDVYFLLDRNVDLNTLSDSEKATAALAFIKQKPKLLAVKNMVAQSLELEKEFHRTQGIDLRAKKDQTHDEKIAIKNKIDLMQSFRGTISQLSAYLGKKPQPTPANTLSLAQIAPSASTIAYTQKFLLLPSIFKIPGLSSKKLFDHIDKEIKDPKDAKEIKNYFKKIMAMLNQGKIPSFSPLPQTTMESLLQTMARFDADPYKPSIAPMQSPMDTPQPTPKEKIPTPPLTPFSKNPYK